MTGGWGKIIIYPTYLFIKHMRRSVFYICFVALFATCGQNYFGETVRFMLEDSVIIDSHGLLNLAHADEYGNMLIVNKDTRQVIRYNATSGECDVVQTQLRGIANVFQICDTLLFVDGLPSFAFMSPSDADPVYIPRTMDMTSNAIMSKGNVNIAGIDLTGDNTWFAINSFDPSDADAVPIHVVTIEPRAKVDDYLLTGHLLKTNNRIAFIFDWLGEYYVIDGHTDSLVKYGTLPLLGEADKFETQGDIPYYQAYSADVFRDSLIFVLREVDFETVNPKLPTEKELLLTLRRRIHVFDEDMLPVASGMLPYRATQIRISGDKLYALHHGENKIYRYRIVF